MVCHPCCVQLISLPVSLKGNLLLCALPTAFVVEDLLAKVWRWLSSDTNHSQ